MKLFSSKFKLLFIAIFFSIAGCTGNACITIAIPVYNVSVFDSVTGKRICTFDVGTVKPSKDHTLEQGICSLTVNLSGTKPNFGDISVSGEGYETQALIDVPHNSDRYACFDSESYTEFVKIYLVPFE